MVVCDISEAATLPLGFRHGDRIMTPMGPATVVGVENITRRLYFRLDGEERTSHWPSCSTKADFEKRGFVITTRAATDKLFTFTVSSTPIRRGTSASVDSAVLEDISVRMVSVILSKSGGESNTTSPPPATGDPRALLPAAVGSKGNSSPATATSTLRGSDLWVWPVYTSGAVLQATNGDGTTQEVACICPTAVRGEPLYYKDMGDATAAGLAASMKMRSGVDASLLLDSLAAEVHPSTICHFARRVGISNVEPAELHHRVVGAMRSSTIVAVSCMNGISWSLQWAFTSVGCSLVARVA
jgi:hypothetical protein